MPGKRSALEVSDALVDEFLSADDITYVPVINSNAHGDQEKRLWNAHYDVHAMSDRWMAEATAAVSDSGSPEPGLLTLNMHVTPLRMGTASSYPSAFKGLYRRIPGFTGLFEPFHPP